LLAAVVLVAQLHQKQTVLMEQIHSLRLFLHLVAAVEDKERGINLV